ncbi:MAG: MFS transporter [Rhodospirillaceae bacterium]|jgi:MFS family permease|nr:MFS transporter [Rhodospirillaceae bacterium]
MSRDHASDSVETPYGWAVVAASFVFITAAYGVAHLLIVSLKPVAAEFDWPRWVPSMAYSSLMLGAGFGGVLMGHWADRRGIWQPTLMGALMVGLGAILASQANSKWMLLGTCFVLLGLLGTGSAFSPLLTNITRWFDRRRGLAVAVIASGQGISGALWPMIFNHGVATIGWRLTYMYYGIAAMLVMLPMVLVLRRPPPVEGSTRGPMTYGVAAVGHLRWSPNILTGLLCIAIVGCCVAMAMPMVHIVAYCSDLGFGADRGAEMLSLLLAAAFISRLGFGFVSDRIGGLRTILIGAALQALVLSLYAVVDSLFGLYVVSGVYGLVFGGIVPGYALAVRELLPTAQAGWRMGVVFMFGTFGMALGGWMGGLVFDLTGLYTVAFIIGVGFNIVNLMAISTLIWLEAEPADEAIATAAGSD